jgi:hypothetical protein
MQKGSLVITAENSGGFISTSPLINLSLDTFEAELRR